jgi:TolB protein
MSRIAATLLVVLALALPRPTPAQTDMRIDVRGGGGRGYQLAVQQFAAREGAFGIGEAFHAALIAGIQYGSLGTVDEAAFLGPRTTPDLKTAVQCPTWKGIGADGLVQGELRVRGGQVIATYRVWDTVRCRLQGETTEARRAQGEHIALARSIADDIVARFTGRRGVSSTQIAFVSDRSGNKEVYLMDADGGQKRPVTRNGSINLFPSWAPDGKALIYTSYKQGRPDVWKIYRGPQPGHPLIPDKGDKYRAVFAPFVGMIGLVMYRGENTDLYTINSGGSHVQRLTNDRSIETSPSFSPDGRQVAFVSDRGGSPQVYVKDLVRGEVRRITYQGEYNAQPAWSPDGKWIAFAAKAGSRVNESFDIFLIDPVSLFTTRLVEHPRNDEYPAWSPDSRKLAFSSARTGRSEIYRIDVDGHNVVRLSEGFGNCSQPAWSSWAD